MKLRWLLGNFVEPGSGLSPREQFKVSSRADRRHLGRRTFWLVTVFAVVAPTLLVVRLVVPAVLDWLGMSGQSVPFAIAMGVVLVLFWPWCSWVYGRLYVTPVRRALRERGADLCIECGYDLRGVDGDRCPECGRETPAASADDAGQ